MIILGFIFSLISWDIVSIYWTNLFYSFLLLLDNFYDTY